MNLTHPFFPRHAFVFKGGSSSSVPAGPIPAPPAPPASTSDIAVTEAKMEAKKQAQQKRGITSTILGGEAAAAPGAPNPSSGKNVILGGG